MKPLTSHNPILKEAAFAPASTADAETMTMRGSMRKTGVFFFILLLGASWTWSSTGIDGGFDWRIIAGAIVALISALVANYSPMTARISGAIYAFAEGAMLGGLSSYLEYSYPGIVVQAVGITFAVFTSMWFAYTFPLIRVTGKLRAFLFSAILGIALIYLADLVLRLFGIHTPVMSGGGGIGIGISIFVSAIASLSLLLDFDFIKRMSEQHAPAELEWFAAFGLMVTLVWLYIEILRLLSRFKK